MRYNVALNTNLSTSRRGTRIVSINSMRHYYEAMQTAEKASPNRAQFDGEVYLHRSGTSVAARVTRHKGQVKSDAMYGGPASDRTRRQRTTDAEGERHELWPH